MVYPMRPKRRPRAVLIEQSRVRMIRQTNAFLTWAMAEPRDLPRIPRRKVSQGGFNLMLRQPGARAAIDRWWRRVLELIGFDG